ncbi:uroporphyrinogen-III C-methyltransferase [Suttonella ornithocola]|uniref:HemX n=1 Tax=Suttonella ornithocola TaxID=279832 RepID=A0A380MW93_9GAMM|nr:uroporphyrinogen-III C-methyltransferase [Suttonella ornithocola]SUO96552.1 HemX [Suttonella ornithocola]
MSEKNSEKLDNKPTDPKKTDNNKSQTNSTSTPAQNKPTTPIENKPSKPLENNKNSSATTNTLSSSTSQKNSANKAPPSHSGKGIALLALLISLASAGAVWYGYSHSNLTQQSNNRIEKQATEAELRVVEVEKTVSELQKHIANNAQGLDKAEVSTLITNALQDFAKNQSANNAGDEQTLKTYIDQKIAELDTNEKNSGFSEEQVQGFIKQALLNFSENNGDSKIDLSEELATIEKAHTEVQQALQTLHQHSQQVEQMLNQKAQTLAGQLETHVEPQTNPNLLINSLTLANIALENSNFEIAEKYLQQAEQTFSIFHLDNEHYSGYLPQIKTLREQVVQLASQSSPIIKIDGVIASIADWSFKQTHHSQSQQKTESENHKSWLDTVKNVGDKIIDKTFKVVHNDDSNLTWINTHPDIQTLIRENVRLDLAFARNALQLHDEESYQRTINNLIPRIQQYFNLEDENVNKSITTLEELKALSNQQIPNLTNLINQIKHTAEQE